MFKVLVLAFVLVFFSVVWANEEPEFLKASYGYREYFIFSHEVDFVQAYARCKKLGWTFATERSDEEATAINMSLEVFQLYEKEFYLGGVHQIYGTEQDLWMWLESAEEISYSNWSSGEPKDGQNCLLRGSLNSSATWTSTDCNAAYSFICQPSGQ